MNKLSLMISFTFIFFTACAMDTSGGDNQDASPAVDSGTVDPTEIAPGDRDRDDDHFTPNQGDCDDEDPQVYPGAPEFNDGRDNDCDGLIDEGLGGCHYGDTNPCGSDVGECVAGVQVCVDGIWGNKCVGARGPVPEVCGDIKDNDCDGLVDEGCPAGSNDADGDGYTNAVDCNDNNAQVHPGAVELCDGLDNNCNGVVDESCGGGVVDADGDGYTTAVDCNDNNANIHPGAVEVCGNNVDENCNGMADDVCPSVCSCSDADGDGYYPITCLDADCQNRTDCNDNNVNIHPVAVEICGNGVDENCNGMADDVCPLSCPNNLSIERVGNEVRLSGTSAFKFGWMVFWDGVRVNAWVPALYDLPTGSYKFTIPNGYLWFIPAMAQYGQVISVPDPCVTWVGTYLCSIGGPAGACPSLRECSLGGDQCPL